MQTHVLPMTVFEAPLSPHISRGPLQSSAPGNLQHHRDTQPSFLLTPSQQSVLSSEERPSQTSAAKTHKLDHSFLHVQPLGCPQLRICHSRAGCRLESTDMDKEDTCLKRALHLGPQKHEPQPLARCSHRSAMVVRAGTRWRTCLEGPSEEQGVELTTEYFSSIHNTILASRDEAHP